MSEQSYLNLLLKVIHEGDYCEDRTGVGTKFLTGQSLKFDLRQGFPLLTTKKMAWKSVVGELLWFLEGSTSDSRLAEITYGDPDHKTIWTDNYEAESWQNNLKNWNAVTENRPLGPIYGLQWRDFFGVDQIISLIDSLRNNPSSRRHIVTAWNPKEIDDMALPPCHIIFQCHVSNNYYLDLTLYQRSADMFLGVPFNIASYSLLMHILAKEVGLVPRFFNHMMGDCHLYSDHVDQAKVQITRIPFYEPNLEFEYKPMIDNNFAYSVDDFKITNYECHPQIKAKMAV